MNTGISEKSGIPLQRDSRKKPKYLLFADWVRTQVHQGQLGPDQQLLSYAEIEAHLGYSQNTVERAYAILEEEGLIYRAHGRGVFVKPGISVKNKTGFIGYIDKKFKSSKNFLYYTSLMQGAQEVADEADKQLVVISSIENFKSWEHLEGVVLCSAGHDTSFSGEAVRSAIPDDLAVVNLLLPDPMIPSIVADDADGIRQLVEHLIGLGHRRIAYISQVGYGPARQHPLVRIRHQAYLDALHQNMISPEPEWVYSPSFENSFEYVEYGYEAMRQWLKSGWSRLGCTAILAHNDFTAMGVIDALREAKIDVPNEVSVAGFDGVEVFRTAPYQLTTVRVPLHDIGASTMRVLLGHMQNPLRTAKVTKLPVQLIAGATTAHVPGIHAPGVHPSGIQVPKFTSPVSVSSSSIAASFD